METCPYGVVGASDIPIVDNVSFWPEILLTEAGNQSVPRYIIRSVLHTGGVSFSHYESTNEGFGSLTTDQLPIPCQGSTDRIPEILCKIRVVFVQNLDIRR